MTDIGVDHWIVSTPHSTIPRFFQQYSANTGLTLPDNPDELPFGKSIALLIGVSKYEKSAKLPELAGVKTSINALRAYLLGPGGFDEVFQVTDDKATPRVIRTMMHRRFLTLGKRDRLLVYFAGHGMNLNAKTGYLLFSKADPDNLDQDDYLPTIEIGEWSELLPVQHLLFMLDACSAGFGFTQVTEQGAMDLMTSLTSKSSRWLITAGTGPEETFDITPRQGPPVTVFGQSLLDALNSPSTTGPYASFLTLDNLFGDLKKYEVAYSNQIRIPLSPGKYPLRPGAEFVFLNPNVSGDSISSDIKNQLHVQVPTVATPAPGAAKELESWRDIAVSLNGTQRQGAAYVVDLGSVAKGREDTLTLNVLNLTSERRIVAVRVEGNSIDAAFEGAMWSTTVSGNGVAKLVVKLSPDSELGRIIGIAKNKAVFVISFKRELRPETVSVGVESQALPSGVRDQFSRPYELCIGNSDAPAGYTLVDDSLKYSLTGDRACGAWATCSWSRKEPNRRCFEFSLQGHNEFGLGNDGVRSSEGHIEGKARLSSATFTLTGGLTSLPSLDCIVGRWHEGQDPTANSWEWDFDVKGLSLLITKRFDGTVGTFDESGNKFVGSISWPTGQVWKPVELNIKSCSEIRTNQMWWYAR